MVPANETQGVQYLLRISREDYCDRAELTPEGFADELTRQLPRTAVPVKPSRWSRWETGTQETPTFERVQAYARTTGNTRLLAAAVAALLPRKRGSSVLGIVPRDRAEQLAFEPGELRSATPQELLAAAEFTVEAGVRRLNTLTFGGLTQLTMLRRGTTAQCAGAGLLTVSGELDGRRRLALTSREHMGAGHDHLLELLP